jgi:hypothetical protein
MPPTTWLTAAEAAAYVNRVRGLVSAGYAGFTERGIRNWTNRGLLVARGRNEDGLQVFTLADVAQAELKTRARALILASSATSAT